MNFNPDEIHERLRIAGEEWADKDAAANALEETKKTLLAELMNGWAGTSNAERERMALAEPAFKLHLTNMVTARKEANRAKVRYETGKVWAELMRTKSANMREELRNR